MTSMGKKNGMVWKSRKDFSGGIVNSYYKHRLWRQWHQHEKKIVYFIMTSLEVLVQQFRYGSLCCTSRFQDGCWNVSLHICIPDRKKERWKSKRAHLGSLFLLKAPSQKSTHPLLISHWPEHSHIASPGKKTGKRRVELSILNEVRIL